MKEQFVEFLINRIGKKLGDIMDAINEEEPTTHVDDIHAYLEQLTHLVSEFIHITFVSSSCMI
jgi:hypothetical protein